MSTPASKKGRLRRGRVLGTLAVVVLGALGALGGWWQQTLPLKAVVVQGTVFSRADEVRAALGVQPGEARIYALDPDVLRDRAVQVAWVQEAALRRFPHGTLQVDVTERTPVALVVQPSGALGFYLDAEGYPMPLHPQAVFDVPLVRGVALPYRPGRALAQPQLRALLAALAAATPEIDALLAEIERDPEGGYRLRTVPVPGTGAPLIARLGTGDYRDKLDRLHAFWHQAVLTQPTTAFDLVDLRFDGQVVTRERRRASGDAPTDSTAARS